MHQETNWEYLASVLEEAMNSSRTPRPEDLPSDEESVGALLTKYRERLREICEHWAFTGNWKMMMPIEAWFLAFRLDHGWMLALRLRRRTASGEPIYTHLELSCLPCDAGGGTQSVSVRGFRQAADFGKCGNIDQQAYDEQPRIAFEAEQNAPAEHSANNHISERCQNKFHRASLTRFRFCARESKTGEHPR